MKRGFSFFLAGENLGLWKLMKIFLFGLYLPKEVRSENFYRKKSTALKVQFFANQQLNHSNFTNCTESVHTYLSSFLKIWNYTPETIENIETFLYPSYSSTTSVEN